MEDLMIMICLALACVVLYKFGNWCGSKIPYDDTHDIRGYRKKPFTKEDLDYLNRICLGKSMKEQQRIIKSYRSLPWE